MKNINLVYRKYEDPSANRYIMSFNVGHPFVRGDVEFVSLTVEGQSFMLHQIRKMIGQLYIWYMYVWCPGVRLILYVDCFGTIEKKETNDNFFNRHVEGIECMLLFLQVM